MVPVKTEGVWGESEGLFGQRSSWNHWNWMANEETIASNTKRGKMFFIETKAEYFKCPWVKLIIIKISENVVSLFIN